MPEIKLPLVGVTYIGRRESFVDRLYGSKLVFAQLQTRVLPKELARRFLRHADQFKPAEVALEVVEVEAATEPVDDTATLLEKAELAKRDDTSRLDDLQDLRDQIANMDKLGLEQFAKTHYRQDIDRRMSTAKLREQVTGLVDLYGI